MDNKRVENREGGKKKVYLCSFTVEVKLVL